MEIVAGIQLIGEGIERIIEGAAADVIEFARHRGVGDAADGQPHAALGCDRRAGHHREIAMPPCHLAERAAASSGGWESHGLDQLVVVALGRHHAEKELACGDAAAFLGAAENDIAAQRPAALAAFLRSDRHVRSSRRWLPRLRVWAWPVQGSASEISFNSLASAGHSSSFGLANRGAGW